MNGMQNSMIAENRRTANRERLDKEIFALIRFGESLVTCWVTNRADHGLGFWTPVAVPVGELVSVEGIERGGAFAPLTCRIVWARQDQHRGGFIAGGIILAGD